MRLWLVAFAVGEIQTRVNRMFDASDAKASTAARVNAAPGTSTASAHSDDWPAVSFVVNKMTNRLPEKHDVLLESLLKQRGDKQDEIRDAFRERFGKTAWCACVPMADESDADECERVLLSRLAVGARDDGKFASDSKFVACVRNWAERLLARAVVKKINGQPATAEVFGRCAILSRSIFLVRVFG